MNKKIKITIKIPDWHIFKKRLISLSLKIFLRIRGDITERWTYLFFLLPFFVIVFLKLGLTPALFGVLFLSFLFYGWDRKIIAGLALFFLICCPILLILEKESLTGNLAIYTYYLMIIIVTLQIIDYIKYPFIKKKTLTSGKNESANIWPTKNKIFGRSKIGIIINTLVVTICFIIFGFNYFKNIINLLIFILILIIINVFIFLYDRYKNNK